jgi:hypothetical protein
VIARRGPVGDAVLVHVTTLYRLTGYAQEAIVTQ